MGSAGHRAGRKFARRGIDKAVEEVVNLSGVDGKQREAGVQMFRGLSRWLCHARGHGGSAQRR